MDDILEERGKNYGSFVGHANITQDMKYILRSSRSWELMENDQREALEMIVHKIGRIVNGDPNYVDSWTDVIGYAKLVEDRLKDGTIR